MCGCAGSVEFNSTKNRHVLDQQAASPTILNSGAKSPLTKVFVWLAPFLDQTINTRFQIQMVIKNTYNRKSGDYLSWIKNQTFYPKHPKTGLVFRWYLNIRPFNNRTFPHLLNTRLGQIASVLFSFITAILNCRKPAILTTTANLICVISLT